ncbi:hypothetical protein DUNSADRAFT_9997 [Dunaliella salina]|uniref:Encoded protein n=1 Tax=Dunaliella salina TaxID=3046 RepID=A0ABQ7GG78_DUNSA|nr:hypothetical protein DUNSADRAFT_9997 [Dunaliella salina]|eukprot:KAF5833618.1 hypothetical protein DUNSADRAFT_9997 [Dunaliella salina]
MARWGSWGAILLGVSSLAAGAAGIRAAITTCLGFLGALLPHWVRRLLPRGLALRFHRRQKAVSLLPVADSQGAQSAAFL